MLKMEQINKDGRGEIHRISGEEMQTPMITLMVTKKGFFRGGDIHAMHDTIVQVVEGIVEVYHKPKKKEDYLPPQSVGGEGQQMEGCNLTTLIKGGLNRFFIPHGCPHYLYSKTDSVVISWGPAPDELGVYDEEMRKFVVEKNKVADVKNADTSVQDK
jgi:hypothetical protein